MKITTQRIYQINLIFFGLMSVVLAIPSITDDLLKRGTFLGAYVSLGYIFLWLFSGIQGVVRPAKLVMWLGLFSFVFSMLPIFSSVYHTVIIIAIVIFLKNDFKTEKQEQEKAKKEKETRKEEPTVFDVWGKTYELDDDDD